MKTHNLFRSLLLLGALSAGWLHAGAEDIDLYAGVKGTNDRPNVLLILDSSANWSSTLPLDKPCVYKDNGKATTTPPLAPTSDEQDKKMGMEKCALYNLIDSVAVQGGGTDPNNDALFNVGIMLLKKNGAYPLIALDQLTTNRKAVVKEAIKNLTIGNDKGSNADFSKALYEAYRYFKGLTPYLGKTDAPANLDPRAFLDDGRYRNDSLAACARNYIIFIANGAPEGSENNEALALLRGVGGNTSPIVYPTSYVKKSDQDNWADEFARFLRGVNVSNLEDDPGIITHGIAVTGASSDGLYPKFIEAMSKPFGGSFSEASNAEVLLKSMQNIFNEIQAVDSVFAAASLPVSVNARGTYLNQVYMGMFRPDATAKPRWNGNLKQYRFDVDSLGRLELVDAKGQPAVSTEGTGFISTSAVSFWTEDSVFWSNQLTGTTESASDSPDGAVVEKGAAAQRLRITYATNQTGRKVLTCVGCAPGTMLGDSGLTRFETDNLSITAAALGVGLLDLTARSRLIEWVRGRNNAGDERGPNPETTVRPSVHGDVLHSRPAVVNYGGSTGVVVFYGANDGMLHAINGNQSGTGAGAELWSFVPQEMFGKLGRLRANAPQIRLSTTVSDTATPRDYFVDGPISVYQKFRADGTVDRAIIYVAMRRGGRVLYAIDVTDPAAPKYLWRKTERELARLGQTWSEPKLARIRGNTAPVLVFGGGYDAAAEDIGTPGTTTMGDRIFVLDAFSGTELKSFATTRSVPADVTLVDSDFDGYIDRAYAVDLGGQVYRIDFESDSGHAVGDWSAYVLADLSGGTSSGRKFFFAPDAIVTKTFTALSVGSGDREKPLLGGNQDHFFQLFDRDLAKGRPSDHVPTTFADLVPAGRVSSITGKGCYVPLSRGEKVVNAATAIGGMSYFGTNQPSSAVPDRNTCSADLGVARSYAMPLFCVAPTSAVLSGGGLPPSPVTGIVSIVTGDKTEQVPFCIGCPNPKNSGIEGSRVNPLMKAPRSRLYWHDEASR